MRIGLNYLMHLRCEGIASATARNSQRRGGNSRRYECAPGGLQYFEISDRRHPLAGGRSSVVVYSDFELLGAATAAATASGL